MNQACLLWPKKSLQAAHFKSLPASQSEANGALSHKVRYRPLLRPRQLSLQFPHCFCSGSAIFHYILYYIILYYYIFIIFHYIFIILIKYFQKPPRRSNFSELQLALPSSRSKSRRAFRASLSVTPAPVTRCSKRCRRCRDRICSCKKPQKTSKNIKKPSIRHDSS